MQRRDYTEEEKNAVMSRYAAGGEEVKQILAEYGVPKSTFNQWLRGLMGSDSGSLMF